MMQLKYFVEVLGAKQLYSRDMFRTPTFPKAVGLEDRSCPASTNVIAPCCDGFEGKLV